MGRWKYYIIDRDSLDHICPCYSLNPFREFLSPKAFIKIEDTLFRHRHLLRFESRGLLTYFLYNPFSTVSQQSVRILSQCAPREKTPQHNLRL